VGGGFESLELATVEVFGGGGIGALRLAKQSVAFVPFFSTPSLL
jgi:hypothetical protein